MYSAGRCDIGKHRINNEDAVFIHNTQFGCLPNLFIVADGMGGHNAGEIASNKAIQNFCDYIHFNREKQQLNQNDIVELLKEGILYSNQTIYHKSIVDPHLHGMGTTFLGATIFENSLYIANVGDSRLYLISKQGIQQITTDHSFVEEMVRTGTLSEEEAEHHPQRNVITRAVGTQETVTVDTYVLTLEPNTYILMCSDGLTNMLHDSEIAALCSIKSDLHDLVHVLIDTANEKGGFDNISVILIDWMEGEVTPCCSLEQL